MDLGERLSSKHFNGGYGFIRGVLEEVEDENNELIGLMAFKYPKKT